MLPVSLTPFPRSSSNVDRHGRRGSLAAEQICSLVHPEIVTLLVILALPPFLPLADPGLTQHGHPERCMVLHPSWVKLRLNSYLKYLPTYLLTYLHTEVADCTSAEASIVTGEK